MTENSNGIDGTEHRWTLAKAKPKMGLWLDKLRNSGNVRAACKAANVSRSTVYYWRHKYRWFELAWDAAMEDACDILEGVAWERSTVGQSDRLLMFLLKAHRPDRFAERIKQDITTDGEKWPQPVIMLPPVDRETGGVK